MFFLKVEVDFFFSEVMGEIFFLQRDHGETSFFVREVRVEFLLVVYGRPVLVWNEEIYLAMQGVLALPQVRADGC